MLTVLPLLAKPDLEYTRSLRAEDPAIDEDTMIEDDLPHETKDCTCTIRRGEHEVSLDMSVEPEAEEPDIVDALCTMAVAAFHHDDYEDFEHWAATTGTIPTTRMSGSTSRASERRRATSSASSEPRPIGRSAATPTFTGSWRKRRRSPNRPRTTTEPS